MNGFSREPYRRGETIPGTQYKFLEVLGAGGHGFVVRAEHAFLGKRVAIKVLLPEHGEDGDLVERMLAEARLLADVEHPNIVSVIDGGMTRDEPSRPYMVMEELRGKPVSRILKSLPNGLGLAPSLEISLGVLDGLDFAHTQCGVVHRDIKPGNIFLHRSATDTTVTKVLDFGIAHFNVRQAGMTGRKFIGTPRYAAPEQIRGEAATVRTDLYAVGLLLYECLYGRNPFAQFTDVPSLVHAHLSVMPTPLRELMDGIPAALDEAVLAMLAKVPADRPASAATVAVKLRVVAEELRRATDGAKHKVQHRTEPTPMANMMVTTRASGSERDVVALAALDTNDTEPGGFIGEGDTTPGAPPFDDVVDDVARGADAFPLASTTPSARAHRGAARVVDRNAETRLADKTPPRRVSRFDTEPMSASRSGHVPTPITSTAEAMAPRMAKRAGRARTSASAPFVVGAVVSVAVAFVTTAVAVTNYRTHEEVHPIPSPPVAAQSAFTPVPSPARSTVDPPATATASAQKAVAASASASASPTDKRAQQTTATPAQSAVLLPTKPRAPAPTLAPADVGFE